jgi:hypothetical protein
MEKKKNEEEKNLVEKRHARAKVNKEKSRNHRYIVQNRIVYGIYSTVQYMCKCGGGQHLFPEPSFGRNGHYSDIISKGTKRVERERND